MGLDMYLAGVRERGGQKAETVENVCQLGYWRKHWGLHTELVNRFAGGMEAYDQRHFVSVRLSPDALRSIVAAMESGEMETLPKLPGYDPGLARLYREQTECDLDIFKHALAWLEAAGDGEKRSVYYEAND